ncbi:MAG: HAMP domain-containing sensor histidine kinase [Cyanobacteria bacterium P01_A01_bin.105]
MLATPPSPAIGLNDLNPLLTVRSALAELPLHRFETTADDDLPSVAAALLQRPAVPGVVVSDPHGPLMVLARSQIFEALSLATADPSQTLRALVHSSSPSLYLAAATPILEAAAQALRRPLHQQASPIGVSTPSGPALVSAAVLNQAYWHLRGIDSQIRHERRQLEQLQNEKMAALGYLVDGVAHEILDPISFIWGNLAHISSYTQSLLALVDAYAAEVPQPSPQLQQHCVEAELDYLQTDLPEAIRSVRGGAHRLRQLAISLQNFCHIDEVYPKPADLHGLLDSLLLLLQSRVKTPLQIHRDYRKLPPVLCFAGQLGQVFMSILTSAVDTLLEQSLESNCPPTLSLTTAVCNAPISYPAGRWIKIVIQDNGPGLPADVEQAIAAACSPQTQLVKESRLAMGYRIVTARHGGCFQVRSQQFNQPDNQIDSGTEFTILLPLIPPETRST